EDVVAKRGDQAIAARVVGGAGRAQIDRRVGDASLDAARAQRGDSGGAEVRGRDDLHAAGRRGARDRPRLGHHLPCAPWASALWGWAVGGWAARGWTPGPVCAPDGLLHGATCTAR